MSSLFIAFQHLAPHHLLSRLVGFFAELKRPLWLKNWLINRFIERYGVDMSEAIAPHAEAYIHFNDFFTRAIRPGARPLAPADILSPADGVISQLGAIHGSTIYQAKGKSFSTKALLGGDPEWAAYFDNGDFATIYLSPKDYHRVHMPIAGECIATRYVPGSLYSVNGATADAVDQLFARNERHICLFETEVGKMAVILVGAMIVAGIETSWEGQITPHNRQINTRYFGANAQPVTLAQGDELGRFKLGSTVILLFSHQRMAWETDCQSQAALKMGQCIGSKV